MTGPGVSASNAARIANARLRRPRVGIRQVHIVLDIYLDQYVSETSFPAGRLLPSGISLATGVNMAPYPPPFPPFPTSAYKQWTTSPPALTSNIRFIGTPSNLAPSSPPFYSLPTFPAGLPYRFAVSAEDLGLG